MNSMPLSQACQMKGTRHSVNKYDFTHQEAALWQENEQTFTELKNISKMSTKLSISGSFSNTYSTNVSMVVYIRDVFPCIMKENSYSKPHKQQIL